MSKASHQDFPLPLRRFIEIDRDGYRSFCYPARCGELTAICRTIEERLRSAMAMPLARKTEALHDLLKYVEKNNGETALIGEQWDFELERGRERVDRLLSATPSSEAAE